MKTKKRVGRESEIVDSEDAQWAFRMMEKELQERLKLIGRDLSIYNDYDQGAYAEVDELLDWLYNYIDIEYTDIEKGKNERKKED